LAFNSGHQSRNLRPAIWGANGQFCAAKILNRACRLGVKSPHYRAATATAGSPQLADIPELRCISCYDCSMPLTLRPSGLSSPAYADQPDYIVCEDGKAIGRMYEDRQTLPELRWFWSRRRRGSSAGAGRRCHSRRHVRRRKNPTARGLLQSEVHAP
jgi:hypothetical protein